LGPRRCHRFLRAALDDIDWQLHQNRAEKAGAAESKKEQGNQAQSSNDAARDDKETGDGQGGKTQGMIEELLERPKIRDSKKPAVCGAPGVRSEVQSTPKVTYA
jgi:hypothetical protein